MKAILPRHAFGPFTFIVGLWGVSSFVMHLRLHQPS